MSWCRTCVMHALQLHREIFLRWRPPFRPLRSSVTITALVAKALKRAGVKARRPGAHILRHTRFKAGDALLTFLASL